MSFYLVIWAASIGYKYSLENDLLIFHKLESAEACEVMAKKVTEITKGKFESICVSRD